MSTNKVPRPANGEFFMNVPGWQNVEGRVYVAFTNKGRPISMYGHRTGQPTALALFLSRSYAPYLSQYNYSVFSGPNVLKVSMMNTPLLDKI